MSKLKEKIKSIRQAAEKLANNTIPYEKVSPEIQQERWNICQSCEWLYKPTNSCRQCGCFMAIKTWMATQRCPIKKWHAISGPLAPKKDGD